jgi:hypothetical protein
MRSNRVRSDCLSLVTQYLHECVYLLNYSHDVYRARGSFHDFSKIYVVMFAESFQDWKFGLSPGIKNMSSQSSGPISDVVSAEEIFRNAMIVPHRIH